MPEYFISTDQSLLDSEYVIASLRSTYWASERPRDVIVASLANSICFGAYQTGSKKQIGFARVITDNATFSWLCDVFVSPEHRSRGLGKRLVAEVLAHPSISRSPIYLGTQDAHGLYERFGFQRWELMRRAPESQPPNSERSAAP